MKRISTIIILLSQYLFAFESAGQTSLNTAGSTATSATGGTMSFSIGQVFDQRTQASTVTLMEGVQQPSEISGPLPVTLIYFKAYATNENQVQLSWSTAAEINNDFFTIERSSNAKTFSTFKTLAASGDKTKTSVYQEMDTNPLSGTSYYRLKQTDKDGTFTYSRIAVISFNETAKNVSTYPNPATEQVIIKLAKAPSKNCNYELFYMDGKLIQKGQIVENMTILNVSHFAAGTYILKIKEVDYNAQTFKIVKI